jgi:hypothetical protein
MLGKKNIFMINPNLRVILLPLFSLIMLTVLMFPVFNFGYKRIDEQLEASKKNEGEIIKLENKLEILREVEDSVLDSMDTSILAVPSVNPSVWKLFQIFSISSSSSVDLLKRSLDAEVSKGNNIYASSIDFSVQGDFQGIIEYLENLNQYVPLFTIDGVSIKGEKGSYLANAKIIVYRATLPTVLPALTQPIKRLTNDEKQLLEKLARMKPPEFTTIDPSEPSDRKDPFF